MVGNGNVLFDLVLMVAVIAICVGLSKVSFSSQDQGLGVENLPVLKGLRSLKDAKETPVTKVSQKRIALGYNANVDVVVDAIELLERLGVTPPEDGVGKDKPEIHSVDDLGEVFMFHFHTASGGERPVKDAKVFQQITEALYKAKSHRVLLGGNAALMAETLANDHSFDLMLGGQVGPKIAQLLPNSIDYIGMKPGDQAVANHKVSIRNDEVHIIMEYKKGAVWGSGNSPRRANRFIISCDVSNAAIASLAPLNDFVSRAPNEDGGPFTLLVAAGLHMLDGQTEAFRSERLQDIERGFLQIPEETAIHFEFASIGDPKLVRDLAATVLPNVDSLGLNEQELVSLFETMGGSFESIGYPRSSLSEAIPPPEGVAKALAYVFNAAQPRTRVLTRIHFHSFGFHIVAQLEDRPVNGDGHGQAHAKKWDNAKSAVAAGSIKALERACNKTELGEDDMTLHLSKFTINGKEVSLFPNDPVVTWRDAGIAFYLAPVLTCNEVVQTVGLGDSISSTALAFQV